MKQEYILEPNQKASLVYQKANQILQETNSFCRLYETSKDLENIMPRLRNIQTGRLKPRGLIFYGCPIETPEGIISELKKIHLRTQFYVLCSGGKDSICLSHYIKTIYPNNFKGLMHIQTGVGIKQTTSWLIKYCQKMEWPLEIRSPKLRSVQDVYRFIVLKYGFPSYGLHKVVMGLLKYHVMRRYTKENKERLDNHALVSGVRAFESVRRFGNYKTPIQRDGSMWFVAPFFKKEDKEIYQYLLENNLKRTPIHDILGMSGECMCGSFARKSEREIIKILDPELDEYFTKLEKEVLINGTERAKKRPIWGSGIVSEEEAREIMKEIFRKLQTIEDLEEIICGVECGPGTMRGLENI